MVSSNFTNLTSSRARDLNNLSYNLMQNVNVSATDIPYRYGQKVIDNDTVQISEGINNIRNNVQNNIQKIDPAKVKKAIITTVLSIGTVVGIACGINKNINKFWKLGEKVDIALKNNKLCNKLGDFVNTIKSKNPLKNSELYKEIKNVTNKTNRIQPKFQWAKMSVLGPKGIFSLTPSEVLKNTATAAGDKRNFTKYLEALVGKDAKICGKTVQEMAENCFNGKELGESFKFSKEFLQNIKNNHGLNSSQKMLSFFDDLKNGKIGEKTFDFAKDVNMKGWVKGSKGNLGETMKKFAIMNSEAAQTKVGKLVQQVPLILGESVSNCINDRSLFGIALCASYLPTTFNEAQDAPKGKKISTVLSEFISSAASWAIGMAGAGTIVYSAASLKNLTNTTKTAKALKFVGKVAGMGLDDNSKKSSKFFGAILRLIGVMTLSSKISTPIDNTVKKAFNLPTTQQKAKIEQQKQLQAMQNINNEHNFTNFATW